MGLLSGETPPGRYGFEDLEGNRIEGREGVVPILKQVNGQWGFIGTAFFIHENGIFITAKHVIQEPWTAGIPLFVCQFIGAMEYFDRPIAHLSWHNTADIAVGVLVPAENQLTGEPLINASFRLTTVAPNMGQYVATYAYPRTSIERTNSEQRRYFDARFYDGTIEEYLPSGSCLLPGPGYRTSMVIRAGASGGPVGGPSGRTFALNSTGFDGTDISHVSRIDEVLELSIPLKCDGDICEVTIRELAQEGAVVFDPPLS